MPNKIVRPVLWLKVASLAILLAGVGTTVFLSGVWRDLPEVAGFFGIGLTCFPFGIFLAAIVLSKRTVIGAATCIALCLALCFGLSGYHDAFWSDHRSDINGIALIFIPAGQALLGIFMLAAVFIDGLRMRRQGFKPIQSSPSSPL